MHENGDFNRDVMGIPTHQNPSVTANSGMHKKQLEFLASYHAKNHSVIGPIVGMIGMIILLISVFMIFCGIIISDTLYSWGIKIVVSCIILAALGPVISRIAKRTEHKNYQYWLYISNDWLGCAMAPKYYRHFVNYVQFLRSQPENKTTSELLSAMKTAEIEALRQTQEDFKEGMQFYVISRHFQIYTSGKYIELTDGKNQMYLPYDSGALEFLKDVALISDVATTYKTNETSKKASSFKEVQALLIGFAFGYAFQLFGMFLAWICGGDFIFTMKEVFVPDLAIVSVPALFMTWIAFAIVRVRWMRLWSKISVIGLCFIIPFALISAGIIFTVPELIHTQAFWIVTTAVSSLFAVGYGNYASRNVA